MYVDNEKVKRRLPKNVALAGCQAPGKLTGGRPSSFPEGEWKLSRATWVETLEQRQSPCLCSPAEQKGLSRSSKEPVAFSSLMAGLSEDIVVRGNRLFSQHILGQRNPISFIVCMPVLVVIQQCFCMDFS